MTARRWIATLAFGLAVALPSAGFAQQPSTTDKVEAKTHKAATKTKDTAQKTADKTGEAISDASITSKIKADFVNEKTLKGSDINVDTNDHVVTLKGTVASQAGKARAEHIAKTTKGVTQVVDNLTIAPKDTAGTTGTMAKAEEKTKHAASATGEVIDDAWITTKIKTDFVNEDALKGSDINVDTNNHVVTLKGTVASLAGKTRAQEIAKTTKGVNRVVNELTVGPKK
jgi:osmotically-inducible protein OsmY